jgi:1-acyl-sn-glycerol-3-phosphate acyltransferase
MMPPGLPPISNRFLYVHRVLMKWFSFFFFGFSSVILSIIVLPPMRLLVPSDERFKKYTRRLVSFWFRVFVGVMHFIGIVNLVPDDRKLYRNLSSKIIVANHPSLLDVVMLISLIPNADCIVNAYLNYSILRFIVRQIYIVNSDNHDEIMDACIESLKKGYNLIIFPEGTRTPRTGTPIVKKGAARVAMAAGCGIVPVHIGGTDKYGLGKKDPWTGFNPVERYVYKISMKSEIHPDKYRELPVPAAVRHLTDDVSSSIFSEY